MATISSLFSSNLLHQPRKSLTSLSQPSKIVIQLKTFSSINHKFLASPLVVINPRDSTGISAVAAEQAPASTQDKASVNERRLYIGNIPRNVGNPELTKIVEEHGTVEKSEVMYDKYSGRSRRFAFVTMKTVEDATAVVEKLNGTEIGGRAIKVNITEKPLSTLDKSPLQAEDSQFVDSPHKVYVGNLAKTVTTEILSNFFSEKVKVLSAKVSQTPGTSKKATGFGFVTFSSDEDVESAISSFNDAEKNRAKSNGGYWFSMGLSREVEKRYLHATEAVIAKFKDPQVVYMVETLSKTSAEVPQPVIVHGSELDFHRDLSEVKHWEEAAHDFAAKVLPCAHFCSKSKPAPPIYSPENADIIQVSVLLNKSEKSLKAAAPVTEYFPALEEARLLVVDFKLDVLCYAAKDLPLMYAVSNLIIPGLVDQLNTIKNAILPNLLVQQPQLRPFHFSPPGILHPITVIYELSYGETEMKQVEVRKVLHLRLGFPFNRPLLRIANALDLSSTKDSARSNLLRKGSPLLKDVHIGIPSSGVSGGLVSLVQGSYEYYHYLQDGYDDSGWGCAYRSLQTIISWFRLQHYSSIDVPSHREIQQSLVEIGDKDPSFIGSREWIGAIELSFVLDKLLGVSCKVINVRSGAELPERCRELALHFENQGTPIMIGGGVLAYTLLGIDYNEASGDCAFLILDPHYTGNDDLKKIVNGGWCGWKKAVDSKGKNFFLQDKFYNLLLPQRPDMV